MTPDFRLRAQAWSLAAALLVVVTLIVDRTGNVVQGYAGVVLAGVSYGNAVGWAARYDHEQRVLAGQGGAQ